MSKGKSSEEDIQIGKKLKAFRKNSGLTLEELSHLWGVSYQQIQKYEKGLNRLSAGRLITLIQKHKMAEAIFLNHTIKESDVELIAKLEKLTPHDKKLISKFIDVFVEENKSTSSSRK